MKVFQEAANFRSAMKKMARSIVRENYGDVLRTGDVDHNGEEVETCAGQLEEYEMVKKNVNEVLTGGRYLWGGKDKEVMTCSCFVGVVTEFGYRAAPTIWAIRLSRSSALLTITAGPSP